MSCVRQWAKEGFKVAMVSRTASKLEAAAAENPGTFAFAGDVTNPASLKAALTQVEQKLGEIHTVVYNAGNGVFATYENVTHEKLEMAMKTNVHGLLTVAQHLGPKMTARGEGVIAVTGATAALRGKPMTVGFATAKAAQRMLTRRGTSDQREFTASTSSWTVASEGRAETRVRTRAGWTPTPSLPTTGTSLNSQRTTGPRSWTVVHGWRIGRFVNSFQSIL
jgi:NAD(P)-dependent dehydrogenase (short-subunit alcohol dehydrogenase family)